MREAFCTLFILFVFLPWKAGAQENPSPVKKPSAGCAEPASCSQPQVPRPQRVQEHPRVFWIIPTYSVSYNPSSPPLSRHDKFHIFAKNATDPFTISSTVVGAGLNQATDGLSGYGQGAAGYGKRLGAGLADETSSGFFTTYLFPSLLHQDPRYFREGAGPFKTRLTHVIIRPLVTRKDSGGRVFNWSGLLGKIAASSISNAYYPSSDRGVGITFRRVALAIPFSMTDHLIDEFGPDLEKRFLHKK